MSFASTFIITRIGRFHVRTTVMIHTDPVCLCCSPFYVICTDQKYYWHAHVLEMVRLWYLRNRILSTNARYWHSWHSLNQRLSTDHSIFKEISTGFVLCRFRCSLYAVAFRHMVGINSSVSIVLAPVKPPWKEAAIIIGPTTHSV